MANVLLGVTGSVAAIYTPQLFTALHDAGHAVKIVATEAACYFFDAEAFGPDVLTRDADEWPGTTYQRGDLVRHIELRRWANLFLIAPLDANTLAKLALGLADNCLTCVYRAWERPRPIVLAPAMNTRMWEHPTTGRHLRQIAEDQEVTLPATRDHEALIEAINVKKGLLHVVAPIAKRLACDDVGLGAMASREAILAAVNAYPNHGGI